MCLAKAGGNYKCVLVGEVIIPGELREQIQSKLYVALKAVKRSDREPPKTFWQTLDISFGFQGTRFSIVLMPRTRT